MVRLNRNVLGFLIELQNLTLVAVKTHLLSRDETGAAKEPPEVYDDNDQTKFERYQTLALGLLRICDLKARQHLRLGWG